MREAARLGVWLLTVHAAGGTAMLRAVAEAAARAGADRPRVLAVTVLTSLGRAALQTELGVPMAVEGHAVRPGRHGRGGRLRRGGGLSSGGGPAAGCPGPGPLVVTPGIRPSSAGSPGDDQVRTATPAAAVRAGADAIVVGRPITGAPDPARAAEAILAELAAAR